MPRKNIQSERLAGIFLLGCLVFNFPFITLFDRNVIVFGIPLLFLYMFGAWMVLIVLMALASKSTPENRRKNDVDRGGEC